MADHSHHRLLAPDYSVRYYEGEQQAHSHDHVQLLYALAGRMELEVDGKSAYVDTASGVVIPAGATHAYPAQRAARWPWWMCPMGRTLHRCGVLPSRRANGWPPMPRP